MLLTGVYWVGPVYDLGGYGNVSRNYIRALEAAEIPVFIHPFGSNNNEIEIETQKWLNRLSTNDLGNRVVLIRHGLPNLFGMYLPVLNVIKNIGITIFETDRLPAGWATLCNRMDDVWVPSQFNYHTFYKSGVEPYKLKVVPYVIDVKKYYPGRPYTKIRFSNVDSFSFLYVSQFDWRKGYDLLIQAFCQEFSPHEPVSLILKVYFDRRYDGEYVKNEIVCLIPQDRYQSQIYFVLESFTESDLIDLYQSSDAYISMDRAGWGLPAMEMMALGKPAIAINWGGYTQFMNNSNSFLIPIEPELVPVDPRLQVARPEYLGHYWADVRVEQISRVLREVYENKEKRERISKKAALDIHFNYSINEIGGFIKNLLG